MSLNIGEGNAVNVLLDFITQQPGPCGEVPSAHRALEAANLLAKGAYRALSAGARGDGDIARVWPS